MTMSVETLVLQQPAGNHYRLVVENGQVSIRNIDPQGDERSLSVPIPVSVVMQIGKMFEEAYPPEVVLPELPA